MRVSNHTSWQPPQAATSFPAREEMNCGSRYDRKAIHVLPAKFQIYTHVCVHNSCGAGVCVHTHTHTNTVNLLHHGDKFVATTTPDPQNEEQKGATLSQMSRFADSFLAADGSQESWEGGGRKETAPETEVNPLEIISSRCVVTCSCK